MASHVDIAMDVNEAAMRKTDANAEEVRNALKDEELGDDHGQDNNEKGRQS